MFYNLFAPYIFIVSGLNGSFFALQNDSFCANRRAAWRNKQLRSQVKENDFDLEKEIVVLETEERGDKLSALSVIEDAKQVLRYNQMKPLQLIIYLCHIILLSLQVFKSVIYSSFPVHRDSLTQEFKEPVLRFVESNLRLCEFVHKFDHYGLYNRLLALIYGQYLILRLRCLYRLLKVAKLNRERYRSLSVMEIDACYFDNLRANTRDWLRLLMRFFRRKGEITAERACAQNRNINKLDRLDRLYFNLIDFDRFYKGTGIHLKGDFEKPASQPTGAFDKLVRRLANAFALKRPECNFFKQRPAHRIDPTHMAWLLAIYLAAVLFIVGLVLLAEVALTYIGLHDDKDNYRPLASWRLLLESLFSRCNLIGVIQSTLAILVLAINTLDSGLLAFSSIRCHSRFTRVKQLLDNQVNFYRAHLRQFKLHQALQERLVYFKQAPPQASERLVRRKQSLSESKHCHKSSNFKTTLRLYKERLSHKQIAQFNRQVAHLVDLVEVLISELRDMKSFFTGHLNIYLIFGTACFAVTFSLFARSKTSNEVALAFAAGAAGVAPMLFSLSTGAIAEKSSRLLYLSMRPLLVNELQLLDPRLVARMELVCEHLEPLENRSFVVLGNFSLTFSSLTSILGWIITGNLLIQRFLD